MSSHKLLNLVLLVVMVASLVLGGSGLASAQDQNPSSGNNPKMDQMEAMQKPQPPDKHGHPAGQMRTTTPAERTAARLSQPVQQPRTTLNFAGINPATAAYSPLAAAPASQVAAPSAPLAAMAPSPGGGQLAAPDYFGVPNWANSPLPLLTSTGTSTNQTVGNALIDRAYATDSATPPGTLGPVFVVLGNAKLPAGQLQNFQVENQALAGLSPNPSAGNLFQAFVLRPTATPNQYLVVYASPVQTVPALKVAGTSEIDTYTPVGLPVVVQANDVIAFYGEGVPLDTGGTNADTLSYPAPAAPAQGSTITLGVDPGFPIYSQDRTYSFAANVTVGGTTTTITGGMQKFLDPLPGLCNPGGVALGAIPACPDQTTYARTMANKFIPLGVPTALPAVGTPGTPGFVPASDYYEIALVEYHEQMHSNLPAAGTQLRGYVQLVPSTFTGAIALTAIPGVDTTNPATSGKFAAAWPSYLGPVIVASGCELHAANAATCTPRPVRVKFTNLLPTGGRGDLFIPTDTTYMGAGHDDVAPMNADCSVSPKPAYCFTENRATLHLHGGNTPWISDGTPHQWTVPVGEGVSVSYQQTGDSAAYVPDMWFDSAGVFNPACIGLSTCAGYTNNPGQGSLTFYWTNQQSGRLMFYHDHAYGITRVNVYAGEAAGYLVSDPAEEAALAAATVPGTTTDLGHMIPLVIQDKSFVPDSGAAGNQLALTDPTWDTVKYGGQGNLWFPHVYMPNQNPADTSGANAFGRWDYGPWFWPNQDPSTFVPGAQPYPCDSIAFPNGPAFPPLLCPGTPNPSGTPEGFMDTAVVNGTAYPTLTVDPTAYRFQILSAGNDRTLNLGLYVADPLTIAVTNAGSGYLATDTVSIVPKLGSGDPTDATASLVVSTGEVTQIIVTGVGAGYTSPPNVTVSSPPGTGATASAVIDPITGQVTAVNVTNGGTGFTNTAPFPVTIDPPAGCTPGPGCQAATADAYVVPAGSILAVNVTYVGTFTAPATSWAQAPTISFNTLTGTGATALASVNTEVKMVDAVPHTAGSTLPLCTTNKYYPDNPSQVIAAIDGLGKPLNATGLPANCYPSTWPTDARAGGVPDPTTAGPPFIEIASEGGLLPHPSVIPSTPVDYEYNRRSITVLNVFTYGLLLGPAERADVIVDFSDPKWAGKTLILYNDAPAPVPAFDPRSDYYTGDGDQTLSGGAPSTLPGYGPNTRTIMQIKVNATPVATAFNLSTLSAAMPGIFASIADKIIVPEPSFPAANGGASAPTYVRIQDNTINAWLGVPVGGLALTKVGAGYTTVPGVLITGGGGTGASASAVLRPTSVASVALNTTPMGSGYTSVPSVNFSGGGGSGASAAATLSPTSIASLTLTNGGGSGYARPPALPPSVTIARPAACPVTNVPGVCEGATATATVGNNRKVVSLTLTNPGLGYDPAPAAAPAVTIAPPPPGGTTATAIANRAPTSVASVALVLPGSGYTDVPLVNITGGGGTGAAATAKLTPTSIASLTLISGGTGFTSAPTVAIDPPVACTINGTTCVQALAVASASTPTLPKTIQELFTLDYGRMNATLGVELPFTNFLIQTTIPYGYVDPPTEIFKDGEVQFWKITHNGVDTHFIHFHLFNVQVINRVGWDGMIKPPDLNEVGWKDTVRMNPLESIIVALRPLQQDLPWQLPNSIRRLDVTTPVGSALPNEFTNVDPTNQPATVTNDLTNFGYEYVWHCHILGHEENDMMRAMILDVPPAAPTSLTSLNGNSISWVDASMNETGFTVQVAPNVGGVPGAWSTVGSVATPGVFGPGYGSSVGGTLTFKNSQIKSGVFVRVLADNKVGYIKAYAAPAVGYPFTTASGASAALLIP